MAELAPLEIHALARIIDELDYYQLMHLKRGASASELKKAYHASSRAFHPDADPSMNSEIHASRVQISKRLTEAYCVLRNPRRRSAYDQHLEAGQGNRLQLSEAKAAQKQEAELRQGKTPQGRQYFSKASSDLQKHNYAGAISNLQMALTFEPGNTLFEEKLAEARELKQAKDS